MRPSVVAVCGRAGAMARGVPLLKPADLHPPKPGSMIAAASIVDIPARGSRAILEQVAGATAAFPAILAEVPG